MFAVGPVGADLRRVGIERVRHVEHAGERFQLADDRPDARQRGLGPDRFEFQMLYGIRRDLEKQFLAEGYRLRLYVPYGDHWYPYFMRRLAERPANLLFLLRNLVRG